ncbi:hypothetical protein NQ176_g11225 [Zarea fungicola]|uniref:Uncharacterized protein n=1 Tax=Zarea fungicola TaxID=93591 RepID=A0ACC1MC19_9HYPO|nr:hypothetical protein NQ176_g11225 [Lecanicillium fungicola]
MPAAPPPIVEMTPKTMSQPMLLELFGSEEIKGPLPLLASPVSPRPSGPMVARAQISRAVKKMMHTALAHLKNHATNWAVVMAVSAGIVFGICVSMLTSIATNTAYMQVPPTQALKPYQTMMACHFVNPKGIKALPDK